MSPITERKPTPIMRLSAREKMRHRAKVRKIYRRKHGVRFTWFTEKQLRAEMEKFWSDEAMQIILSGKDLPEIRDAGEVLREIRRAMIMRKNVGESA